jgi:hypothetical protein
MISLARRTIVPVSQINMMGVKVVRSTWPIRVVLVCELPRVEVMGISLCGPAAASGRGSALSMPVAELDTGRG